MAFRALILLPLLLTTLFLTYPPVSQAQLGAATGDALTVNMSPEYPRPFQRVDISLENYSTDLTRATITWKLNGKEVLKGIGETRLSITTGALGTETVITISALTTEGRTMTSTLYIAPAMVDLIWEANTYVPPFYKGKALYPIEGEVVVSAVPHLISAKKVKVPAKDLYYEWSEDRKPLQALSGVGRDSIRIQGPILLKPTLVEVVVSSKDHTLMAQSAVILNPTNPEILFYENNPARGPVYEKALTGSIELGSKDGNVFAVPYFFSTTKPDAGDIGYTWIMNGTTVGTQTENFLTLVTGNKERGTASISVDASHLKKIFQTASRSFSVSFGGKGQEE